MELKFDLHPDKSQNTVFTFSLYEKVLVLCEK